MTSIAIVLLGYPVRAGGGYKTVYQYANFLVERGHNIHILHMRPEVIGGRKVSVIRRTVKASMYCLGRHWRPHWFKLDKRIRVSNFARQSACHVPPADILIATAMETASFVASVVTQRHAVGVYFIQGYEDWNHGSLNVDRTWALPLRKIVVSPWLKRKAQDLGVQCTIVSNAIDGGKFPAGAPISQRPLQLLALVSDDPLKRTDLVIEVMTAIAERMPHVILRTFGVVKRPAGLPSSVIHNRAPTAQRLRRLYQESRVYLCTSDAEGFGLPPAEALSSGAAVVSTDIEGVKDATNGSALFSPVGDAALLSENVIRLLVDPSQCQTLATVGQSHIRSYTPDRAGARFEREILSLLVSSSTPPSQ